MFSPLLRGSYGRSAGAFRVRSGVRAYFPLAVLYAALLPSLAPLHPWPWPTAAAAANRAKKMDSIGFDSRTVVRRPSTVVTVYKGGKTPVCLPSLFSLTQSLSLSQSCDYNSSHSSLSSWQQSEVVLVPLLRLRLRLRLHTCKRILSVETLNSLMCVDRGGSGD